MHLGSRCLRHSHHPHGHPRVCGLFAFFLPFYFLLFLPPLFLFLNCMKSMVNLHNSCNEGVNASDDPILSTDKDTDLFEASDHHYHEQFMESFSSTSYSKLDDDRAWSSQEWKAEATTHDRSGQPDKNFLENGKKSST